MMKSENSLLVILAVATFVTVGAIVEATFAQRASVPKPQDKLALGEDEVKQLLLLMDADKNGRISKQEFMKFMEAEFERLDKNKNGELDVKELTHSQLRARKVQFANVK
jgi:5S rRNA maturation endonuclease (ribonuclease M5)